MHRQIAVILLSALLITTGGCMVHPITLEQEFNIVGEQKELSIGRNAHPQILQQFGTYHDPRLQRYVNELGQKIVGVCRRRDISYHFSILDDPMVNAFATPGGYIYITRGLLAYLNSEAELAGVLAHEIGHVVGRDSAALMSQGLIAQLATLAGVAGAATSGSGGDVAMATSQLFNSIMLGFSREREYLADEQSVEYIFNLGYDPLQIKSFLRTLSFMGQGPAGPQQYLVTHPYIFDRISRVESKSKVVAAMHTTMGQLKKSIDTVKGRRLVLAEKYKAYLDGLAFGPKDDLRRIKLYRVRPADSFESIARKTLGSSTKAKLLAELNGIPISAQLIPGAKIKIIY
ncbi:MAG: M48 family metalloprotease [Deltaproteobacteria bacterium]|nr:M48 family metalloprotease [Deltaproteobacteria bacterium]